MKLLKLSESGKVSAYPHPAATEIPEFKNLIDKADKPERVLAYIFHMHNTDSPYTNFGSEQKEKRIKEDLFGDEDWSEPEYVKKASEKYVELIKSPEERLLESAIDQVYEYRKYFNAVDATETDENGKLKWKMKDVTRVMEKLPGVVDTLEDLRDRVEKGEDSQGNIRGGVEPSKYNK